MKAYRLSVTTTTTKSTIEGEATPATSADGRQRVVWSCDEFGRGASVTIKPLDANTQFVLHGVRVYVVASLAGADDA
jgi:hypothetical protein